MFVSWTMYTTLKNSSFNYIQQQTELKTFSRLLLCLSLQSHQCFKYMMTFRRETGLFSATATLPYITGIVEAGFYRRCFLSYCRYDKIVVVTCWHCSKFVRSDFTFLLCIIEFPFCLHLHYWISQGVILRNPNGLVYARSPVINYFISY